MDCFVCERIKDDPVQFSRYPYGKMGIFSILFLVKSNYSPK